MGQKVKFRVTQRCGVSVYGVGSRDFGETFEVSTPERIAALEAAIGVERVQAEERPKPLPKPKARKADENKEQ